MSIHYHFIHTIHINLVCVSNASRDGECFMYLRTNALSHFDAPQKSFLARLGASIWNHQAVEPIFYHNFCHSYPYDSTNRFQCKQPLTKKSFWETKSTWDCHVWTFWMVDDLPAKMSSQDQCCLHFWFMFIIPSFPIIVGHSTFFFFFSIAADFMGPPNNSLLKCLDWSGIQHESVSWRITSHMSTEFVDPFSARDMLNTSAVPKKRQNVQLSFTVFLCFFFFFLSHFCDLSKLSEWVSDAASAKDSPGFASNVDWHPCG